MSDDIGQRVAKLEARMDNVEKSLDKIAKNDFVHVEARLTELESRRSGKLSRGDWVTIITTIIVVAGSIVVAAIQVLK